MSLIDRIFIRFDEFKWAQIKRRALFEPTTNRVMSFSQPKPERKIPMFGSDSGFGQDWASDAPVHYRGGPVPQPILHNVDGHVAEDAKPLLEPIEAYVDPNISPRGSRTSESTDQTPIRQFTGETIGDKWDGVVRNTGPRKCLESDVGKNPKEPTLGDLAARDLKKWDFDFSF